MERFTTHQQSTVFPTAYYDAHFVSMFAAELTPAAADEAVAVGPLQRSSAVTKERLFHDNHSHVADASSHKENRQRAFASVFDSHMGTLSICTMMDATAFGISRCGFPQAPIGECVDAKPRE